MKVKPDEEAGEGNREADKRYRHGVRETVERTDADERAEQARDISDKDLNEAKAAENADSRAHFITLLVWRLRLQKNSPDRRTSLHSELLRQLCRLGFGDGI